MTRKIWIVGAVVAATAIGATAAVADQGRKHGGMEQRFEKLDADSDGKITRAEMDAHAKARFEEADTNKDGSISPEEMTAQIEQRHKKRAERRSKRMIKHLDANNDGALSLEEMQAGRKGQGRMFEKLDADGDGAISKEEFAEMKKRGKGWRKKHGGSDD